MKTEVSEEQISDYADTILSVVQDYHRDHPMGIPILRGVDVVEKTRNFYISCGEADPGSVLISEIRNKLKEEGRLKSYYLW